jgi:galactose mutarotase-like enzyme
LELSYSLNAGVLRVGYRVTNTGKVVLPVSLGAHPAFRWPLVPGVALDDHRLDFAADEPAPVRRLEGGLLRPNPEPTPIVNRSLALRRELFAADALILDKPSSRSLRYVAPGSMSLEIGWEGFRQLGLWSRKDGEFLCIEPWHGMADPVGFKADFIQKPGVVLIEPGEEWEAGWWVRVVAG